MVKALQDAPALATIGLPVEGRVADSNSQRLRLHCLAIKLGDQFGGGVFQFQDHWDSHRFYTAPSFPTIAVAHSGSPRIFFM
jgi:hypothetical protein